MESNPLEELLSKIQQIQSVMIGVATDFSNYKIQDEEENYVALYKDIDLEFELLQEDGIHISNPNAFSSLWEWYRYYKGNLGEASLKRKYIYELYLDAIDKVEGELYKHNQKISPEITLSTLAPVGLEDLVSKIEELKSIMIAVAAEGASIDQEESGYTELYQEIASKLGILRCSGVPAKNPNTFRSLWHWHSYWSYQLDHPSSRREYIDNLYVETITPIKKALLKQRRSPKSIEEFIEDLRRRFSEQISEQPQAPTTASTESSEQNKNTKTDDLPAGSRQVVEPDYTRQVAAVIPTEPMIDFAIITAIRTERLAVLNTFEIDEKQDRERKGSRTYWRKRLFLQNEKFYEIVVAQSLDMANVNAAILANDILHHWKPAAVLMVGIAATAKPEPKQKLGNLVIGKEVYYYETGKVTANGKLPEPKYIPGDATLLDRVQALPGSDFSILVDRPDGTDTHPEIEIGVIASGDKVIADAAERDAIASANRKIMAIEMEGYGVISAAWQNFNQVRCLVIRALCDYADSNKHDQWHLYAATVAAGFAKYFLLDEPLDPRNPSTASELNIEKAGNIADPD